jgi:hypothetical protein
MISFFARFTRRIAPWLLAIGLLLSPSMTHPLHAQEDGPVGSDESKGRPLDGYLGTLCLAMLALFIVGKSARR